MMSINLKDICNLNIYRVNFFCIINGASKSEAISLLQNIDLSEKVEHQKIVKSFRYTNKNNLIKIMAFSDAETKNHTFHSHKSPVLIDYVDTNKMKVSNKVFF